MSEYGEICVIVKSVRQQLKQSARNLVPRVFHLTRRTRLISAVKTIIDHFESMIVDVGSVSEWNRNKKVVN